MAVVNGIAPNLFWICEMLCAHLNVTCINPGQHAGLVQPATKSVTLLTSINLISPSQPLDIISPSQLLDIPLSTPKYPLLNP